MNRLGRAFSCLINMIIIVVGVVSLALLALVSAMISIFKSLA
jgi:hypothetical protein